MGRGLQEMRDSAQVTQLYPQESGFSEAKNPRFKAIRKELREAGLPLIKQSLIADIWGAIFGTGSERKNVDEVETSDLIRSTQAPYTHVPDVFVDELVKRYRQTIDPQIQEALLHLVNNDPLRLSSMLGLAFYFDVFDRVKDGAVRQRMIANIIGNGEANGRVIPMLRKLASALPDDFTPAHVPAMMGLLSRYPALLDPYTECSPHLTGNRCEGLLHNFANSSETLPKLFEDLFDDNGRLVKKPSLAKKVLAAIPKPRQAALLSRLLDTVGKRDDVHWKEYGMARFASRTGHLYPYKIDKVHILAEQRGDSWRRHSTPILVDSTVFLEEDPLHRIVCIFRAARST